MVYQHKNVIVGAADVYISKISSALQGAKSTPTDDTKWWPSEDTDGLPTSPVGPNLPAFTANAKASSGFAATAGKAAWRHTGYTTDGVEVSYEPDFGEVTVDQALDTVKMFKQAMRVSVNTTLAEATLENLLVAWGQNPNTLVENQSGDDKLAIAAGELGDDPVERSLAFVGQAPRGVGASKKGLKQERVYHVRRALQVESSAHSLSRTDATTFPVSFRCLPDLGTVTSGSEYGVIIQRVIS